MELQIHKKHEDFIALLVCSLIVSLGITFLNEAGLITGGIAGLTLYLSKITEVSFGTLFFTLNLPFYILAYTRMGVIFTIKTLIAVTIVSIAADNLNLILKIEMINSLYAALIGGVLIGLGMLIIFRHKMSLGGFNIFVLYLQEKFGIRAGKIQMLIDSIVVLLSLFIMDPILIGFSVLGVIITNLIIAFNHIPGRYRAA